MPAHLLEAHHVLEWSQNGTTAVSNGVMVCYRDHQLLSTNQWNIHFTHGKPRMVGPAWLNRKHYLHR
ncbi:HNH endonuclease [Okibacterium endophyticum]